LNDLQQVLVAIIIKTQGNKGEVAADLFTDFPGRFQYLNEVHLEKDGRKGPALKLENYWLHKGRVILKFQGIDSIADAQALVGSEVKINRSELMAPTPGSYYQHDLIDCVITNSEGCVLGSVVEVLGNPGNYLLRVRRASGDFLVPFAESYLLKVDIGNKLLVCDLPEGLDKL
jgi:16S rRNA processing protein RimM